MSAGFIRNDGQWPKELRFATLGSAINTLAREHDVRLRFEIPNGSGERAEIAIQLPDRKSAAIISGVDAEGTLHHFFKGDDPEAWRTGVPSFARVEYQGIIEGVDLVLHSLGNGRGTEYDLVCAEGSRVEDLVLRVSGASRLEVDDHGDLVIHAMGTKIVQTAPRTFLLSGSGSRRSVPSTFRLVDSTSFGFDVTIPRAGESVVVDPEIVLAEALGIGIFACDSRAVAEDLSGNVVVAGITDDPSFPITPGAFDSTLNPSPAPIYPHDTFISVLSTSENQLLHSTYLGGTSSESISGIHIRENGDIIATGMTFSTNFPTTVGSFQTTAKGISDAFVFAMPVSCDQLRFSTRLGGTNAEFASGSAIASNGDIVFTGRTDSTNFPVTPGCFASQKASISPDMFVSRIHSEGTHLIASTYIGGTSVDGGGDDSGDVAVSVNQDIIIGGFTSYVDYPTTPGSFQPTNPSIDSSGAGAVVTRFSPDLSTLIASTYVGIAYAYGTVKAIAIDSHDRPLIAGLVKGNDFLVTPGVVEMPEFAQANHGGMFLTRLTPDLSALSYSLQLLSHNEYAADLVVDGLDCAIFTGSHGHYYNPTTEGCYDAQLNFGNPIASDGIITRVAPDGRELWYSTTFGGWAYEELECIALARSGDVIVGGSGVSYGFPDTIPPTPARLDSVYSATVTRMSLLPKGTDRFGNASPGSGGSPVIGVTRYPSIRPGEFGLTCHAAPKSAPGWLVVSPAPAVVPFTLANIDILVGLQGLVTAPVHTSPTGAIVVNADVSRVRPGTKLYAQFVFAEPSMRGVYSSSAGLEIVVQD